MSENQTKFKIEDAPPDQESDKPKRQKRHRQTAQSQDHILSIQSQGSVDKPPRGHGDAVRYGPPPQPAAPASQQATPVSAADAVGSCEVSQKGGKPPTNNSKKQRRKKEVTLIGDASHNLTNLVKRMDMQYEMAVSQKQGERRDQIDLEKMNKYVGYKSQQLSVTLEQVSAQVKMLQLNDNNEWQGMPNREIIIVREKAQISIISDAIFKDSTETFKKEQILAVRVVKTSSGTPSRGSTPHDQTPSASQRKNRFKEGTRNDEKQKKPPGLEQPSDAPNDGNSRNEYMTATLKETWLQNDMSPSRKQYHFSDGSYGLALKTTNQDYIFFLRSREDRDIMLHEMNNICKQSNVEVEIMSARQDVMDRIDPIESFNAWNLSMVCIPIQEQQEAFQASGLKQKQEQISEQAQIIKAEPGYVSYIRDGIRCFVSETLRKELYVTDGDLYKESKTKMKAIKGKYRKLFVAVDYKKHLIRFKEKRIDPKFLVDKDIPFHDVIEIKRLEIDIFKGEHKVKIGPIFRSKFLLRTLNSEIFLFSKCEVEREVWIESLLKILDINEAGITNFSLKNTGQMYFKSINQETPLVQSMHRDQQIKKQMRATVEGVEIYKTEFLQVTKTSMKGTVMKAIENISMFHKSPYHKRYFLLEFGQPYCYFYEKKTDSSFHKSHKQSEIIASKILDDTEIQSKINEKNEKRSQSFMRRRLTAEVGQCQWNFPFSLQFQDKEYELYAPTRNDREQWIHILSTIAEMNKQGVKLESMSPFDYLREQEQLRQKLLEESKMTQSARAHASNLEVERQLFEQVHIWLRLNQDMMQQHRPKIKRYESPNMRVDVDGVRGLCYLITRTNQSISLPNDVSTVSGSGQLRMTKIELFLNMKIQTFLVQKIGVTGVSKYTFNEIAVVEPTQPPLKIEKKDFETNKADPSFKHCFRIQVKNNPLKIVACQSLEDHRQWIRCFQLIIQMKNLTIDSGKVNIFTFEQFREYQLRLLSRQYGLSGDDTGEPIEAPQSAVVEFANNSSTSEVHSPDLLHSQANEHPLVANRRQESAQESTNLTQVRRPMHQRKASIEEIMIKITNFESDTFAMSFRYIEGYLCKEIDSKGIFRRTKRHLRYFRIIYTSGKLNIKEDKSRNEMRSFHLKDLLTVKVIKVPEAAEGCQPGQILSIEEIHKKYKVEETSKTSSGWQFTFKLEFTQRCFTLSARTKKELDEWVRIFSLVEKMNKIGFSVADKNPYVFEDQQEYSHNRQSITLDERLDLNEQHLDDTQNITSMLKDEKVDFGLGSVILRGENDPDRDNVNTTSMAMGHNRDQLIFNSHSHISRPASEHMLLNPQVDEGQDQDSRFAQQVAANLKQMNAQQLSGQTQQQQMPPTSSQAYQSAPSTANQNSLASSTQQPVVNQNITVQNITIKQMTMMQQSSTHQPVRPVHPHHNQMNTTSDYTDVLIDNNQRQTQNSILRPGHAEVQRASSVEMVEVQADLNDNLARVNSRPKSSLDGGGSTSLTRTKKKKKKKVKKLRQADKDFQYSQDTVGDYEAEDPYNTTSIRFKKTSSQAFEDDRASSLGGFAETESQVYRTDTVQKFVNEPVEVVAAQHVKKNTFGNRPVSQAHIERGSSLLMQNTSIEQPQQRMMSNFLEEASDYAMNQALDNGRLFQSIPDSQDGITLLEQGEDFSVQDNSYQTVQIDQEEEAQEHVLSKFKKRKRSKRPSIVELNHLDENYGIKEAPMEKPYQSNFHDLVKSTKTQQAGKQNGSQMMMHVEDFEYTTNHQNSNRHKASTSLGFSDAAAYGTSSGTRLIQYDSQDAQGAKPRHERNNQMRISMSKIRMAGNQDTLQSLDSAQRRKKQASQVNLPPPAATIHFTPNPSQGKGSDLLMSQSDYNAMGGNAGQHYGHHHSSIDFKANTAAYESINSQFNAASFASPQVNIPTLAIPKKKKKKKLILRKRNEAAESDVTGAQKDEFLQTEYQDSSDLVASHQEQGIPPQQPLQQQLQDHHGRNGHNEMQVLSEWDD